MSLAAKHAFVVCAYKENPFVEETIKSLEAQTVATKIMLSTSTPSEYLEQICLKHDIPYLVNSSPNGAGSDWNFAIRQAKAQYVTLAHQDDYYEPTFVEEVLGTLNNYPSHEVKFLYTDYYELRNGSRVYDNTILKIKRIMNGMLANKSLNSSLALQRRILAFGDPICCPAVTYNTELLGNSFFNTTYINSCDYKTYVDLAFQKGRMVYIPKPLMGHRIYEGSATTKNLSDNIRKSEDAEILSMLWPKVIANAVNNVYALSEKSNSL